MKYAVIDIETTGINPDIDKILSIGIIIEDTNNILPYNELPKLYLIIPRERIEGSPKALEINRGLISVISNYLECKNPGDVEQLEELFECKFVNDTNVISHIYSFLYNNGINPDKILAAGKNFSTFDKLFINKYKTGGRFDLNFSSRTIDPAILYVDWKNDENLPSLQECKNRAGIVGNVTHNALEDAWDTLQVLRFKYN